MNNKKQNNARIMALILCAIMVFGVVAGTLAYFLI